MAPRFLGSVLMAVPLMIGSAAPSMAQEVYQDRYGVWRYVEPPVWDTIPHDEPQAYRPPGFGPPVGVIRRAPDDPGAHLRSLVPSYDEPDYGPPEYVEPGYAEPYVEPGYEVPNQRAYADPYGDPYADPYYGDAGRPTPRYGDQVERRPLDGSGGGTDMGYADPYAGRGTVPEEYLPGGPDAEYNNPQQLDAPLGAVRTLGNEFVRGLASYAAAKRSAVALSDPGKRSQAVRSANAWLVTLSHGPVSSDAIRAIDSMLGVETVDKDTVQLPGAGTEVNPPGAEPSGADRDAAQRVADYLRMRSRGETAADALAALPKPSSPVEARALAALDNFLGISGGSFAATR
jgi:hypothetical protein